MEDVFADRLVVYQQVLDALQYRYRGYELNKIISAYLLVTIVRNARDTRGDIFKNFFRAQEFKKIPKGKAHVLITLYEYMPRKDYQEIWNYVKDQLKDHLAFSLNQLNRRWRINLKHVRTALRITRPLTGISGYTKLQIAATFTQMLNTIDHAERQIAADVEKYVCFCSVSRIENLLTQYFNKRNIPTFDLQHGATRIYHKNKIDEIEYTNIVASVHFTWGDYSRDELLAFGFPPGSVVAGGYPRQQPVIPLQQPCGRDCIVFLSRIDFEAENQQILQVLQQLNAAQAIPFRFAFKLHPSLDTAQYAQAFETTYQTAGFRLLDAAGTLQQIFQATQVDFCIVVNTSCYYECYLQGKPTLRFFSPRFDIEHAITADLFSNAEELNQLVQGLYTRFSVAFNQEAVYRQLQYALGINCNEYARLLNPPASS